MKHPLKIALCAIPSILMVSCATGYPDEDPTPRDSDLEPEVQASSQLISVGPRVLPETRPFQLESILGGDIYIKGRFKGDRWYLAYAPGVVSSPQGAQVISSSQTTQLTGDELALTWSSALLGTSSAGAVPTADDTYTLFLTAESSSANGETQVVSTDTVQVRLDNTPPVARLTRLCLDPEGTDCFGFTANPADFGASNQAGEIFSVPEGTGFLYVYGLARDKNFASYTLRMVGGQASDELFICGATPATNAGCVGEQLGQSSDGFGYGQARDSYNQPTLASSSTIDAYSDDTLLAVWSVGHLTPDAYGLHLQVSSEAHWSGDDDANGSSTWVTFLIEDSSHP